MNKLEIKIKGMHCKSCEFLIEEKVREIPEVKTVEASFKNNRLTVYSRQPVDLNQIYQKVHQAGYNIGNENSKSWISKNPKDYLIVLLSGLFILILYIVAKKTGLFNFTVLNRNPSGLGVVALVGLTAGVSTCMALVGGLVLSISAQYSEKHRNLNVVQKLRPHIYFNLGRLISFFLLGGLIGIIGKTLELSGLLLGVFTIVVGIVMLVIGLQLTGLFPKLSNISITIPSKIGKLLGVNRHKAKEYSHFNAFLTGALTFFLPCGLTQAMQLFAISLGSFFYGGLIMAVFAAGTIPGLLGVGVLTAIVRGPKAKYFFVTVGVIVTILAILNIINGYSLSGITFSSKPPTQQSIITPITKDNYQIIQMTQSSNGYSPNVFTVKKGVPVKWIINSNDSNTCAASIYSQKLKINELLDLGENIIEFTPNETGKIVFSCSMGMYRGVINVTE